MSDNIHNFVAAMVQKAIFTSMEIGKVVLAWNLSMQCTEDTCFMQATMRIGSGTSATVFVTLIIIGSCLFKVLLNYVDLIAK